jgi:LemA protein
MIVLYNKLIKLNIIIEKEYSNIDIDLKKRSDLIPKLVEVVKAYMEHEQDTLTKLVESRNKVVDAKDKKEINEANNEVSSLLKDIFALAENYPDLKASSNFLQLQEEINHIEEDLSESRKNYNKSILEFNNKYMVFPTKIFASILGFKKQEYFKITEEEKEMPEIDFDK